jgi:hypothetical protein
MALAVVGPLVEDLYGRGTKLLLFMVTGVAGNVASDLYGTVGVAAGASGALMGLIGVVAGWGQRAGTTIGRQARNDMIKWCLYTVLFGFFIGADNAAHLGGFAAGVLIGFAVRPERWRAGRLAPLRAGGALVGLGAAGLAVWLALSPPASALPLALAADPAEAFAQTVEQACGLRDQGDVEGGLAVLRRAKVFPEGSVNPGMLDGLCDRMRDGADGEEPPFQ